MGVSHFVNILLWNLEQVRAAVVRVFLEACELMERGFDGVLRDGAGGFGFEKGAGGLVPEFEEVGVEGGRWDAVSWGVFGDYCEGVRQPLEMVSEGEAYQGEEEEREYESPAPANADHAA